VYGSSLSRARDDLFLVGWSVLFLCEEGNVICFVLVLEDEGESLAVLVWLVAKEGGLGGWFVSIPHESDRLSSSSLLPRLCF